MSVNNLINNFVVRFANVNGTGSASANYLFAKAVFREVKLSSLLATLLK